MQNSEVIEHREHHLFMKLPINTIPLLNGTVLKTPQQNFTHSYFLYIFMFLSVLPTLSTIALNEHKNTYYSKKINTFFQKQPETFCSKYFK